MRLTRTINAALTFLALPGWVALQSAAASPPLPSTLYSTRSAVVAPHAAPTTTTRSDGRLTPSLERVTSPDQLLARTDQGDYPELASKVALKRATWLDNEPSVLLKVRDSSLTYRFIDGVAVEALARPLTNVLIVSNFEEQDQDSDGVPDQLDGLLGAKKTLLLRSPYVETYRDLPYPRGDVPRNEGVCTDVIVRALRNAGYDLQRLVHEDAKRAPKSYPGITKLDKNIDHRRVRNLLVYFKRHFTAIDNLASSQASSFLPGDIVLFNTYGNASPDHVGIVSDTLGPSGLPLIINSWTVGYVTSEMDLLANIPTTHRFRLPTRGNIASSRNFVRARNQRRAPSETVAHQFAIFTRRNSLAEVLVGQK